MSAHRYRNIIVATAMLTLAGTLATGIGQFLKFPEFAPYRVAVATRMVGFSCYLVRNDGDDRPQECTQALDHEQMAASRAEVAELNRKLIQASTDRDNAKNDAKTAHTSARANKQAYNQTAQQLAACRMDNNKLAAQLASAQALGFSFKLGL